MSKQPRDRTGKFESQSPLTRWWTDLKQLLPTLLALLKGQFPGVVMRATDDHEGKRGTSNAEGYLSYRAEWHAAAWGFASMFFAVLTGQIVALSAAVGWLLTSGASKNAPGFIPYPKQFARESAYVLGHMVPGLVLGIAFRAVLVALGVDVPPLDLGAIAKLVSF